MSFAKLMGKVGPVKSGAFTSSRGRSHSRSPDRSAPTSSRYSRSRSRSGSRSRSRSSSSRRSGSGSDNYSEDESQRSSPRRSHRSNGSSRHVRRRDDSRDRARERSGSRDRDRRDRDGGERRRSSVQPSTSTSRHKVLAGVTNPRLEAERSAHARAASHKKQAEVAAAARRAMSSTGPPAARRTSSTTRPASATAASRSSASATTSNGTTLRASSSTATFYQTGPPSRSKVSSTPVPPLPPCHCTAPACREEFRLLYSTLAAHTESATAAAEHAAELRRENALLRAQLALYRLEGDPRTFEQAGLDRPDRSDAARALKATTPANASTTAPPPSAAADDEDAARRRRRDRERERDRRMEQAKLSASGGGVDEIKRAPTTPLSRTGSLPRSSGTTALAVSVGEDDADDEPRFRSPVSPLRAFGGAGSERLDLGNTGNGGSLVAALSRTTSGGRLTSTANGLLSRTSSLSLSATGTSVAERDEGEDLVADLNPRDTHTRAAHHDREREARLSGTQEFDVGYASS